MNNNSFFSHKTAEVDDVQLKNKYDDEDADADNDDGDGGNDSDGWSDVDKDNLNDSDDSDLDAVLITAPGYGGLTYYENIGSTMSPAFDTLQNLFIFDRDL